MLKKLRFRFVGIAILALSILLAVQTVAVNLANIYQRDSDTKAMLTLIAENNGTLPNRLFGDRFDYFSSFLNPFGEVEIYEETPHSTRYFVVEMTKNVVTRISTDHIAAVSDESAFRYASHVYSTAQPGFGFVDLYRYFYMQNGNKSIIVFMDFQKEIETILTMASISIIISLLAIFFLLGPIYWLSKLAMRPVEESIKKQKQFITDASHELKTPLAIISANTDVLELCEGENEWLTSIRNQTSRMNGLVKNLVTLSKLGEVNSSGEKKLFNLSEAVLDTASNFESSAMATGKEFEINVSPSISYKGDELEIRQLVSILCDNAVKYTNEGGSIRLSLYKSGKNIQFDMFNTCEHVDPDKTERLFDRFYRADASRSRETGGYGIGLSIAKAIVDRHHGKIKAVAPSTTEITFKITL